MEDDCRIWDLHHFFMTMLEESSRSTHFTSVAGLSGASSRSLATWIHGKHMADDWKGGSRSIKVDKSCSCLGNIVTFHIKRQEKSVCVQVMKPSVWIFGLSYAEKEKNKIRYDKIDEIDPTPGKFTYDSGSRWIRKVLLVTQLVEWARESFLQRCTGRMDELTKKHQTAVCFLFSTKRHIISKPRPRLFPNLNRAVIIITMMTVT